MISGRECSVSLKLEGQHFTRTVNVSDALLKSGCSLTIQPNFPLNLNDFNEIKRPQRKCDYLAISFLFLGIGLLFSYTAKYISNDIGYYAKAEVYELIGGVGALIFSFIFFIAGFCLPNNKKGVIKKIDKFFKDNKPTDIFLGSDK